MFSKNKRRNVDDIQKLEQILKIENDIKKTLIKFRRFF